MSDLSSKHIFNSNEQRLIGAADIHSHILPGIDDGAVTMDAAVLMAAIAVRGGTRLMTATPHRYYGGRELTPDLVRGLVTGVRSVLKSTRFAGLLDLRPGQEIPLRPETGAELQAGTIMTLGDNGVYVLVEPPFETLPAWSVSAIEAIVAAGFRPVLAHPERNAILQRTPELVEEFTAAGAAVQITAMSVVGQAGPGALDAAHCMIERGLAAIVASDCHSPSWRSPNLRAAFQAIRGRYGIEEAKRLFCLNPTAVITGEPLVAR